MFSSRKPDITDRRSDRPRSPDFAEAAVLERDRLRMLGREFEQALTAVQMASMDELTLLTNLHGFLGLAQRWLDACQELGKPASLLYFDLDCSECTDPSHGRNAGDGALKSFADVLRIAFRESDVVARVGGDEFAVLLTGTSAVEVAHIRTRLNEILDERGAAAGRRYPIRFRIDQLEFNPARHRSAEALMKAIDRARHAGAVQF
jgi:diguanylate cyclase (GGDEF)-like protein